MIAGTHSGVGKTLITMGLTAAFKEKGLRVQVFKVGPDYIDPSHHRVVSGRPCRNLDSWMLDESALLKVFEKGSQDADLCLIEGVMGLFDGHSANSDQGSSAEIAKLLNVPILLVLDASGLARSAAAVVQGYTNFDPKLKFAGVFLNNVGSEKHAAILKEAIESNTAIPVLGFLPKEKVLHIPERHLGLVPAQEKSFEEVIETLKKLLFRYCDISSLQSHAERGTEKSPSTQYPAPSTLKVRIAYAWDEAFHFYYQDNLDFLEELGAELVPFSPIRDPQLPEGIHALYFGGGFPEVFARQLESNRSMMNSIRSASSSGIPIYAECGGLMYLSEGITDLEGNFYPMTGVIPGKVEMADRLQNFGYQQAQLTQDCWAGRADVVFRAHEFHYSTWSGERISPVHRVQGKNGAGDRTEGYLNSHILASYLHLHFLAVPERAERLVEAAKKFRRAVRGTQNAVRIER